MLMVAVAGTGWVLAPSLVAYVKEADRYYPQRDRQADGSIGDLAHQARVSDHNPSDGFVHAVDLDEDLAPGLDLIGFAEKLRLRKDPRIKYVIYEGRIFKSYASSTGPAWKWLPYSGVNAHTHHLHLSILHTDAARNDLRAWGFAPAKPAPVPPTPEDDDDMSVIVYYKNPESASTHAYHVQGIHAKYCVESETTERLKLFGVKELNTRSKPIDVVSQNAMIIVDGPCRNVP